MSHTKGKWEIKALGHSKFGIYPQTGITLYNIAICNNKADSEYICKAVNNFERMKDELKDADKMICQLCVRLNPQHADCTSCPGMHDIKQLLKELSE